MIPKKVGGCSIESMTETLHIRSGWHGTVCLAANLLAVTKLRVSRRVIGPMAAALVSLASQALGANDRYTFSTSATAQETAREIVEELVGDLSPLARPCRVYVVPDSRGADFLAPRALEQLAAALVRRLQASSYAEGCGTAKSILLSRPQASADSVESLIQQLGGTDVRGVVLSLAFYRWEEIVVLGRLDDLEGKAVASSGLLPIPEANTAAAMRSTPRTAIATSRKAASSATTSAQEMERVEEALQSLVKSTRNAGQAPQPSVKFYNGSQITPTDRRYRVQVAALSNEADARRAWRNIQAKRRLILGSVEPYFERSETRSGVVYRVQVGSFPRRNEAADLCAQLKELNTDCFVVDR